MKMIRFSLTLAAGVVASVLQAEPDVGQAFNNRTAVSGPATLEGLRGEGALVTDGAVTVKVGPGESGRLFAAQGEVELVGRAAEDDVDSPVAGAYLHLDASDESTMTFEDNADGFRHVTEWRDADGGPNSAGPDTYAGTGNYIPYSNTPFVCDDAVSPSGLRMLDFGDAHSETPARPCCCLLKLAIPFTNAQELFWVGQHLGGSGACVFGGKKMYYFEGAGNDRLFSNDASSELRDGDLRLNNQRVPYDSVAATRFGDNLSSVYVASAAFPDSHASAADIELLGSGRYIKARTGRIRIGEILVYTNILTASQRARVNGYLMKKWLKDSAAQDFAAAVVGSAGGNATISVPDGQVAKVERIAVENGTLVKTGDGTLKIGALTPSSATVEVQGGAVRFESAKAVSTLAPAADPYLWLDADKAESLVTNKIDYSSSAAVDPNSYYVTRWNDCRGGGHSVYAEVPQKDVWPTFIYKEAYWFQENFPWVAAGPNGHKIVHFGSYQSQASWMWLQPHNVANAYEGFIVARHASETYGRNFFGSSNTDLLRGSGCVNKLIDPKNANAAAQAALWLFDGKVRDPALDNTANNDNVDFHVVSFASSTKLRADLLAKDRLYANGGPGGMLIGEVILYDRKLTPAERLATTAYLMKKWRNQDVPEAKTGATAHSIAYASATPVVVDTDEDCTFSNISGGNGTLVKRGAGEVVVPVTDSLGAPDAVSVEQGALSVDFTTDEKALLDSLQSATIFDLDAMDAASFSNEVAEAGARTNVIAWTDTLKKGVVAYSALVADNTSLVPADGASNITKPATEHPQLVSVEMPDGKRRPTVDFGTVIGIASMPAGAGMQFKSILSGKVLEIHTVYADHGNEKRGIIVGCRKGNGGEGYAFQRADWSGALLSAYAQADVKNGYIAVDMDASYSGDNATTAVLPSGFHLISYAPLSAQNVGSLAMDRNARCGGCRISEQIAFNRALTDDERAVLQKYLMVKWGLAAKEEKTVELSRIAVAQGSALDLEGLTKVDAETLSGGGTVTADAITGVSQLEISGSVDKLTVEGEVTFGDSVTVELTGNIRNLDVGEHVIFKATSIANGEAIAFAVTGDSLRANRIYTAFLRGNQVILKVEKKGLCVIVK